jgi:hypothetical protein
MRLLNQRFPSLIEAAALFVSALREELDTNLSSKFMDKMALVIRFHKIS